MPGPKSLHSRIASKVFKAIQALLAKSAFGEALVEACYVLSRDPLTVRQPDVSVLSTERIQSTAPDDYFEGAPELAVEVVSPSDSAEDLEIKVEQYLQSGAKQVWVLYPKTKRLHLFRPGNQLRVLDETKTLDAAEFFPGFSIKVADLFLSENHVKA
jgi:Uma2 family endonuclease